MEPGKQLQLPVASRTRRGIKALRFTSKNTAKGCKQKMEQIDQDCQQMAIVIESDSEQNNRQEELDEQRSSPVVQRDSQELDDENENGKRKQYAKGRFTPEEQKIITDAVGQFLVISEISYDDFLLLLQQKNVINKVLRKARFFQTMAKTLPHRSVFSCYRFIKRCFNGKNRKGKWSEEQTNRLVQLVKTQGKDWQYIGKVLGRSTDNVYDRYKTLGYQNANKRSNCHWQLRQFIRLLLLVNESVEKPFLDQNIRRQRENEVQINAKEAHLLKENHYNFKDSPLPLIHLAIKYVNGSIRSVNLEKISWQSIARKIRSRSLIDCKNKFMQLLEYALKIQPYDDRKIIQFIKDQSIEYENEILWRSWSQDQITWLQAKNRFALLKKSVPNKSVKTLASILEQIMNKLQKKKGQHI